nr:MAG TPA: Nucleotide modification associated domain 1 [Caudoviricetes sp.]
MTKLNPTTMKTQYDGQYDTFRRKNHDYGNSFEESLDKFGIIASLVRMQDKMLRLESLTDDSKTQQVGSESLLDTLEDLSNYAAMTACWLKGVQAEDDVIRELIGLNEAYDFLEEQVTRAAGYMSHIRAHGKVPLTKDIGEYVHAIAHYALEQYPDPHRIVQQMDQILVMREVNPNDALILCSGVTDCIRNITNKDKGSNMTKAKDKARGVVMKGSRGNSNVIVMASRGSGKGLMKAKSLLEELGVPKEDIKEIFEGLEDNDDE